MKVRQAVAALALSAAGLVGIVSWEGYRDRTYIPVPGDVPTIGFGRTDGVKVGERTDPIKELRLSVAHIAKDESVLRKCIKVPMHQHEWDAHVSIAYNVGPYKWCKSTSVRKLNEGDYKGSCLEMLRWDKGPGGVVLKGLQNRRKHESDQCLGKLEN